MPLQLQATTPGSGALDLGYLMSQAIDGQAMAITERALRSLVESIQANRFVLPRDRKTGARITEKGTAIVEIHGVLLNRSPWLSNYYGVSFYEALSEQCRRLESHADVKRVLLDINSPGGLVAGVMGCAEALERLATKKPLHALAHDMAASAGYWLAAVAESLSVTRDGEVGSIGVRAGHISYAEMLERDGIQVREFSAGATKTDGSPYHILSAGEAAEEQFGIDRAYDRFVAHVVKHRPGLGDADVRATEARIYAGEDAVDAGLADRVESLEEMVERLEKDAEAKPRAKSKASKSKSAGVPARLPPPASPASPVPTAGTRSPKGKSMTLASESAEAGLATAIAEALVLSGRRQSATPADDGRVSRAEAEAMAKSAADKAVADDRARVKAILGHAEAKGREGMAAKLAFDLGASVEQAGELLATAPKAEAASSETADLGNALAREMKKSGNAANVKPEAGSPDAGKSGRRSFADWVGAQSGSKSAANK